MNTTLLNPDIIVHPITREVTLTLGNIIVMAASYYEAVIELARVLGVQDAV